MNYGRLGFITLIFCSMYLDIAAQVPDTKMLSVPNESQLKTAPILNLSSLDHAYGLKMKGTVLGRQRLVMPYFPDRRSSFDEQLKTKPYIRYTEDPKYTELNFINAFKSYKKPKIKAFLVGNQTYSKPLSTLSYSGADVTLMKALLKNVLDVPERNIAVHLDLNKSDLMRKMRQFSNRIQKGKNELVIIYFSGYLAAKNDLPLPIDNKRISETFFLNWIQGIKQDTLLIIDGLCEPVENSSNEQRENKQLNSMLSLLESKTNIIELKQLSGKIEDKEGSYFLQSEYQQLLETAQSLVKQMNVSVQGNSLYTLLICSVIADFGFYLRKAELSISEFFVLIVNKVNTLFEKGISFQAPMKWPIFGSDFVHYYNEYLLFAKKLREDKSKKRVIKPKNARINTLYKEALRLKKEGKFDLAAMLFLNLLNKQDIGLDVSDQLFESYLAIAELEEDDTLFKQLYRTTKIYKDRYQIIPLFNLSLDDRLNLLKKAIRLNHLGNEESQKRNYIKALQYYEESARIKEKIQHTQSLWNTHNNIGVLYMQWNKNRKAIRYFTRTLMELDKSRKNATSNLKYVLLKNLSYTYLRLGQNEKSAMYEKKASAFKKTIDGARILR